MYELLGLFWGGGGQRWFYIINLENSMSPNQPGQPSQMTTGRVVIIVLVIIFCVFVLLPIVGILAWTGYEYTRPLTADEVKIQKEDEKIRKEIEIAKLPKPR